MPATQHQNERFISEIFRERDALLLDQIIDWIKVNMCPHEVFSDADLHEWAIDHGYESLREE